MEPIKIDDGKHTGIIREIDERKEPYAYIDIGICFKQGDKEVMLKASYPDIISSGSKLGKLIKRMGIIMEPGKDVELDIMKDKAVEFVTIAEETERGTFAKVVQDSVKPVQAN